jgi:hypothetical protein
MKSMLIPSTACVRMMLEMAIEQVELRYALRQRPWLCFGDVECARSWIAWIHGEKRGEIVYVLPGQKKVQLQVTGADVAGCPVKINELVPGDELWIVWPELIRQFNESGIVRCGRAPSTLTKAPCGGEPR